MQTIRFSAFGLLMTIALSTNVIYDYSVPKMEGGSYSLSSCQGKKVLVINLPLQQNTTTDSLLYSLDTLAQAHQAQFKVVAVPAREDGYSPAQKDQLLQWYRSKLGEYIILTDGLYTRKSSGTQQHPLFQWLTKVSSNGVFDIDVQGPGFKFFANAQGKLYAVLRPQSRISGISVQKIIAME